MRVCVLHILLKDYFEDTWGNSLRWQRLSDENYHYNKLNTCLPPKLKSTVKVCDWEERLTTSHVKKRLIHMYLRSDLWDLLPRKVIFASHLVRTAVAWVTRWLLKFVDEVGSTVFYNNIFWVFATGRAIIKADIPVDITIFYSRMNTIQPAWPVCATSVCWHTRCRHFCSCSSHKTIPSPGELVLTQHWSRYRCNGTALSISITQVLIIITWVGY